MQKYNIIVKKKIVHTHSVDSMGRISVIQIWKILHDTIRIQG